MCHIVDPLLSTKQYHELIIIMALNCHSVNLGPFFTNLCDAYTFKN